MTINPQRAQALFLAALEIFDSEARRELLERECSGDAALRQRVEDLLAAHDAIGGFDAAPSHPAVSSTIDATAAPRAGMLLAGRYKLLESIGEGGMGTVWMAEQKEPVRRRVAVKLVKAGMDSKSVLARFEAERQALAMMDHPHIAKVFDGGLTEQGRPFFVMEYVKGVPLTQYCDQARVSLKERLQLFMPICQAVQHAHQKGIIHRDLKPSNILICLYDGKPVPKVIDFGLAKAMHQSLTEQSLHTAHGMMVGTPLYMSPEQAEHNNLDVDTRTDIYSLGVILYELLTGSTPLERQQLKEAAYNEILRLIKEVEPPKPSTRLSSSQNLASVAAQRNIEPNQLKRSVTGDLDWIVMKALDKERSRRYETANGLSRDVERYLNDEAVEACPPSHLYRIKKFIHRNRAMATALSAVAAALVIGMLGFAWQASVANYQRKLSEAAKESETEQRKLASDERDRAIQAKQAESEQRQLAEAARVEAESQKARALEQEAKAKEQAAIAEAVAKFQTDMLAAVDPNQLPRDPVTKEPLRDTVTVVQAMEAAVKALDEGSLKDQPLVEAGVRNTIGRTLQGLGRFAEAEQNLRKSLEIFRAVLPARHPDVAACLNNLGALLKAQNKLVESEPLHREALQIWRALIPSGHPEMASGLNNLAGLLQAQNKLAEAESLFREALDIRRAAFPAGHPQIAMGLSNLGLLLKEQNKLAEAEPLYREALEIRRAALPAGHPDIAASLNNLASLLRKQNKLAEAESLHREALAIRRAAFPNGHPQIAESLNNLALLLQELNKLAEAEPLHRKALDIYREALPAGHPDIAASLNNLALLLLAQNKFDQSIPLFEEALKLFEEARGRTDRDTLRAAAYLGVNYKEAGRLAEAIPLLEEAYQASKKEPSFDWVGSQLLDAYTKSADPAKPESIARVIGLLQVTVADTRAILPKDSPKLASQLATFSQTLLGLKAWEEAEPLLREALTIRQAKEPNDWRTFNTQSMLGGALLGQKKFIEAESLLILGYQGMKEREAAIPPQASSRIFDALDRLVELYNTWHAAEPDKGYDTKAAQWQKKLDEFNS